METTKRPLIYDLLDNPVSGQEIEDRSFAQIDAEAPAHNHSSDEWQVVRRLIHTTADFAMSDLTQFSADAIKSARAGLKAGGTIYADSNMIRSGLSIPRLKRMNSSYERESILCHVADEDIAAEARKTGLPRSYFANAQGGQKVGWRDCSNR